MRTLTGKYRYQMLGHGTNEFTCIPDPLTEKIFPRPADELMLLIITAHDVLGTLEGMVRFTPNASALRTLLLTKETYCSLQINNKGISFYEMLQITMAEQKSSIWLIGHLVRWRFLFESRLQFQHYAVY